MPAMTSAELNARKFGQLVSRATHNTQGFDQPVAPPVVKPEKIESAPSSEPPLPPSYALRQHVGQYGLVKSKGGGQPRPIQESDLEELLMWAVPRFQVRHPRCTVESMLPFLRMAIAANEYKVLRTDHVCGLFSLVKTPWEPMPVIITVGVVGREEHNLQHHVGHQALRIYKTGLDWAYSLKATEFTFDDDWGIDLSPIAKSLKMDTLPHPECECRHLYRKRLEY